MIQPVNDQVVIRPISPDHTTDSGILLVTDWNPDTMGTVVRVGEGKKCETCGTRADMPVKPDDLVIYPYEAGQKVTIDGEEFVMMRAAQILAILTEEQDA